MNWKKSPAIAPGFFLPDRNPRKAIATPALGKHRRR